MDGITVRDIPSLKELERIGLENKVHLVSDSAFSLYEEEHPPEALERSPLGEVKISISVRHWGHFIQGNQTDYENAIVEFLNRLNESSKSYKVFFVSSCVGTDGYKADDRKTAKRIFDRLKSTDNVTLVNEDLSAKELIRFYRTVDLNIGTRMHTNIFFVTFPNTRCCN